ncbi:MAG: BatD family protein [Pseudomonadota bacterium]
MVKLTLNKTLFLFILLVASANSFAESLKVYTDRNPVKLDESFHLIFKSTGSSADSPDFSPLEKDFDILSQNQSTQIQIINGQQSHTKQWTLTVMAKRTGNLTIPAITFGQEQTTPALISVQEPEKTTEKAQASLFLEVEATPETPYVQSQVLYKIRLFYALNIQSASLSEPSFSGGEVLVKKLGKDQSYQTQRDGKPFSVFERKYALFPQQSGPITIEAINFQAQVRENRAPRFNNFFNQPSTHIKRLRSNAIKLEVKPIPSTFKGKNWLPANALTLKDNFSDNLPEFKEGEPVTRTLTLSADGLTVGQLPEFIKFRKNTENIKQYTDQPKLDEQITYQGIKSARQEKIAIIPSKAGEYTLPAIEIPWWNTQTNEMAIIKLPARSIKVAATTAQQQALTPVNKTLVPKVTMQDNNRYYELLHFIFAFGWIVTLIAWWWTMRGNKPIYQEKQRDKKIDIKKLKKACHNNNAQEAKEGLLAWAKAHWQTPHSLGEISRHCAEPLQAEIQRLNQFLYGNSGENWQGAHLWKAFKAHQPEKVRKKQRIGDGDGLAPLYLKEQCH